MGTIEGDEVHCADCGRENRSGSRFCAGCGHTLAPRCGSCERELAADAAFCDGCGSVVAGAIQADPVSADDAVRKTVTALFCDLVGSTAFGERVDAESARDAMTRYRTMAQTAIESNGGSVTKFIGDGVMALFGVPEMAEDDAERAVRAGLALQEGFAGIGGHISDRHGIELGLRVGINTGEVVIAEDDDDIVGDALNTAARLEAACTPGRVLVGESTWRLTRSAVDYGERNEIAAKGKDVPVAAFEVVATHPDEEELATPFVGRVEELARLRTVLEDSILDRSARMVTVVGAPGVGKTRLARELRHAVDPGFRAHEVRCERAGATTFAPVADLLRAIAGIADSDSPVAISAALRVIVANLDDADRVADLLGGFLGATEMRSTEEMFFAVRRLFEVLGDADPVMFVVDDIQWAEPLFLDLLEHLAEWVQTVPLVIVALARPEIRETRPGFAQLGRSITEVVTLEGLDSTATGDLAAQLLGTDRLPAGLLAKIPESTEGNPLFVRELVRMLVDDGVISNTSGSWELVIDLEAVEVPPTVITLLASRVERMAPDERRVLELASVVGPDFAVGALAAIGNHERRADLDGILERLRRKELVEPTGTYLGDEPVFRFHHVLIRDAAYRRLLKGTRAELHTAVGEWTERAAASLVGEYEVTIANHYEQAHLYRHELDLDDERTATLGRRAAALFVVAADRALGREDLSAAASLAGRALRCIPDNAPEVTDLLVIGCEANLGLGEVGDARPLVDRLASVAADDARLGAWLRCFQAELVVYTDPGGLEAAAAEVDEVAALFETLGDQGGVAKARLVRAAVLARLGRIGDCEGELDLALSAARAVDDRRRVTAVLGAAPVAALWGPSPVPRAGGRCLDVVRLLRITTGAPAVEAVSVRCQAVLEGLRGRFDTAREMLAGARATVEELGLGHGLLEVEFYAGIVELLADDPVAAEPHLRLARDGLGRLGIGAEAGQAAAYLARALLLQDRLDEAEELVGEADALAGQNPQTAIVARSVSAEVLAAQGDTARALDVADEAVRLAALSDILVDHANAVASQARVRAAAGDIEGARHAAASANALYEQKGATVVVRVGDESPVGSRERATVDKPDDSPATADRQHLVGAGREPMNTADGVGAEMGRYTYAGRIGHVAALLADDLEVEDRQPLIGLGSMGKDEHVASLLETDFGPPVTPVEETIAVRGDRLFLGSHTARSVAPAPTVEVSRLSVLRVNHSGLIDRLVIFGSDQFVEAVAELDRLYMDSLEPREAALFEAVVVGSQEFTSNKNLDRIAGTLHPDLRMRDHRDIGWPDLGAAGMLTRLVSLFESTSTLVMTVEQVHRLAPRGAVRTEAYRITTADGSSYTNRWIRASRMDEAGLMVSHDLFAEDDLVAALAHHDREFRNEESSVNDASGSGSRAGRGSVWNVAAIVGNAVNAEMRSPNPQLADLLADPALMEQESGPDMVVADGFGLTGRRTVAVRGDRLALVALTLHDGTLAFSVEETDDDGRVCAVRHFASDDIGDAFDHLVQRCAVVEPGADVDAGVEFAEQPEEGMVDVAAEQLAEDVHGSVWRMERWSVDGDDWFGTPSIHIFSTGGGLDTGGETFADDQAAEALARFAELAPPADGDHENWNQADAWAREMVHSHIGQSMVADDAVIDDRRPLVAVSTTGPADIAELSVGLEEHYEISRYETVAVRGDVLALALYSLNYVGDDKTVAYDFLSLFRWTENGELAGIVVFEPEQLAEALEELDRLHAESLDPVEALQAKVWSDVERGFTRGEPDWVMSWQHPDVEYVDHRAIGFGTLDRSEYVGFFEALLDEGSRVGVLEQVLARSEFGSVVRHCLRSETETGASGVNRHLVVTRRGSAGLNTRVEWFEAEDADRALAALAEHAESAECRLVNRVVTTGQCVNVALRPPPPEAAHLFTEGKRLADVAHLIADPERLAGEEHPFGVVNRTVVAIRDDRLCLVDVEMADGERRWSVEQLDEDGRLCDWKLFERAALADAHDHLDELFNSINGRGSSAESRLGAAMRAGDVQAMDDLLRDDIVLVDHRALGFGSLSKTEWLNVFGIEDSREEQVLLATEALAATESGGVYRQVMTDTHLGVGVESLPSISVLETRGDQVVALELFEEDDDEAALARFAELTAGLGGEPADDIEPWNRADELSGRSAAGFDTDRYAENVVIDDRRKMLRSRLVGRAEVAHFTEALVDRYDWVSAERIAVRGDNLVLHLVKLRSRDEDGAIEYEFVELHRWTADEYLDLVMLWDPEDLADAVAELVIQSVDALSPRERALPALGAGMERALGHRDASEVLAQYHPAIVSRDWRNLSFPDMGLEEMRDRVEFLASSVKRLTPIPARIHPAGVHGLVTSMIYRIEMADGSRLEQRFVILVLPDPATGLVIRLEQFEWGDHDRALARLDELLAEMPRSVKPNLAVAVGGAVNRAMRLSAPELDQFVADPQRLLTTERHPFGVVDRQVLAVRGDELALIEVGLADGSWCFSVEEVDEAGHLVDWTLFGATDLAAAADRFDRRFIELAPDDSLSLGHEYGIAQRNYDVGGLDRLLADDFGIVDHRPMGWGEMDKATTLDGTAGAAAAPRLTTLLTSESLAMSENALLVGVAFHGGPAGARTEGTVALSVIELRDGRIRQNDLFPVDDLAAARARFGEITSGPEGQPTHEPWNEADRVARASIDDQFAGRHDAWAAGLADDVVLDDRRRGEPEVFAGKVLVLEEWGADAWGELGALRTTQVETLACRGDNLVVLSGTNSLGDILDYSWIGIDRINDAGRVDLIVLFDTASFDEAMDELDRLHTSSLTGVERSLWLQESDSLALLRRWEFAAWAQASHPNFRMVDHRELGFGTLDAEAFLEANLTAVELVDSQRSWFPRMYRSELGIGCLRFETEGTTSAGADVVVSSVFCKAMDLANGGLRTNDRYETNRVEDALAKADELIVERRAGITPNVAVVVGGWASSRARQGCLRERLTDDFTAILPDGTAVTAAQIANGSVTPEEIGFGAVERRVISVLGEACMLEIEFADGSHRFSVEQVSGDHLLRVRHFGYDDLRSAGAHLDGAAADDWDEPLLETLAIAMMWAQRSGLRDSADAAVLLSDGFRFVDHRELGYPAMAKDEMVAMYATLDGFDETVWVVAEMLAVRPGGVVSRSLEWSRSGDGWMEASAGVSLFLVGNGQITAIEYFADYEQEAALARLDELVSDELVSEELDTEAWQSPDLVNTATMLYARDTPEVSHAVIAVRGDLGALVELDSGELVAVTATPAGEIETRTHRAAELAAAVNELNLSLAAELGSRHPAGMAVLADYDRATTDIDLPALRKLVADDFRHMSSAYLGGLHDNHDRAEFIEMQASLAVTETRPIVSKVLAVADHMTLAMSGLSTPADGADRWTVDVLIITVERDGQIVRSEAMDPDDMGVALARFAELDREINGDG